MRRMVELDVTALEILVAGDPGNGKANFIQRFLENFPPSAEVRRRHATVYCLYQPDEGLRIQLYDVNSVEKMDRGAYDKMDAVLFYYVANDPESFQSLEKWIGLMDSPSLQTKNVLSILVADSSNLGNQRDVAKCLAEQANKLKDSFGIKLFIESSFEDEESAFRAFEIIIDEVFSSKLSEQSSVNGKESDEKSFKSCPTETFPGGSLNRCLDEPSSSSSSHYCSRTSEGIQKLACFLKELQV